MAKSLDNIQQKQIFIRLLIFSLVTVMIWVFFSLFQSQHSTAISPELQKLALPLTPTIDIATLDQLQQKRSFSLEELLNFPIYTLVRDQNGVEQVQLKQPGTAVSTQTQVQTRIASGSAVQNSVITPTASPTP